MEFFLTYVFGELNNSANTFLFLSILFSLLSISYFFILGDKKQGFISLPLNIIFFMIFILSALVSISSYCQINESKEYLCYTVAEKLFSQNEHKRVHDILGYQCRNTDISKTYTEKEFSSDRIALNIYETLSVNSFFENDFKYKDFIIENTKNFLEKSKESDYFAKSVDKDTVKLIYKILETEKKQY